MSNNIFLHGRWVRLAAQAPFDFALLTSRPSVIDVEQRRTIIIIVKKKTSLIPYLHKLYRYKIICIIIINVRVVHYR